MLGIVCSERFAHVQGALNAGRFRDALEQLPPDTRPSETGPQAEWDVLVAELTLETGGSRAAERMARSTLSNARSSPSITTRARRVLANTLFYSGNVQGSREELALAKLACGTGPADQSLSAHLELLDFALACRVEPIDAALSRLPSIRRAIARAANPHLFVLLRIAVARAEVRRRARTEARRHHQAALNLIGDHPNVWLDGLIHVDVSAAAMVAGDLHGSLEHAQAALDSAEVSGHSRTKLAALINIAQVLAMKGETESAKRHLDEAMIKARGNQHLVRASLDALANLWITRGDLDAAGKVFSQAEQEFGSADPLLNWDAISELNSRSRLAQHQLRWHRAHGTSREHAKSRRPRMTALGCGEFPSSVPSV